MDRKISFIWMRTVLMLGAAFALGAFLGELFSARLGFAIIAAGVLLVLWRHIASLARLLRWLADTSRPVPEGSGAWEEVFDALYRYVRSNREERDRLAAAVVRFRNAALAMPDGVAVLDAGNHIEWCNPTAELYLGIDSGRDTGQHIANLVRQPDFVRYLDQGDFGEPLILRLTRAEPRTLRLRVVPYGQDQKLLLASDITQAERLEIMRRDFVANVSHELRTPLTVVSGFLETLADGRVQITEKRAEGILGLMQSQTGRMTQLIEDLLTLSTLESSSGPTDEAPIDMRRLVDSLLEEARALSGDRHRLLLAFEGPSRLFGSEKELRSAFGNILSNAVRYTPAGGEIRIAWTSRGDDAQFSVADSGPGFESRHIPRLTERFYRVDNSRSRDTGGTGLGLAIVKHVLSRHQGQLEIESEPGKGSRFAAVLPARRVLDAGPAQVAA